MAAAQIDDGARLLYRNVDFNTWGFLNAREDFIRDRPEVLARVLKVYEKARAWIAAHPDDTAKIVSEESRVSLAVAKLQLSRNDFSQPQPGAQQIAALKAAAPILVDEQLVKSGTDLNRIIDTLIDAKLAQPVVATASSNTK
jgi:sulfonate transport system substrate-binding protein